MRHAISVDPIRGTLTPCRRADADASIPAAGSSSSTSFAEERWSNSLERAISWRWVAERVMVVSPPPVLPALPSPPLGGGLRAGVVPGRRSVGVGMREVLGGDCKGMEGGDCTRSGVLGGGKDAGGKDAEGMEAEGMDAASATDDGATTSTAAASVPRSRPTRRYGVDGGVASAAPTAARTGAAARGPKASHSL